jgi:hypothetical protein
MSTSTYCLLWFSSASCLMILSKSVSVQHVFAQTVQQAYGVPLRNMSRRHRRRETRRTMPNPQ